MVNWRILIAIPDIKTKNRDYSFLTSGGNSVVGDECGWGRPLNYKFLESDADFYDFMGVPHCPQGIAVH